MNGKDFMLCHSIKEEEALKLDGTKWKANFKFDGERIVAVVDKGQVMLINRRGNIKNEQFREVVDDLSKFPDCILDGEVISKDNNFNKLASRAGTKDIGKLRNLEKTVPITYMIFDLLQIEGKNFTQAPLGVRISELGKLMDNRICLNLKICIYWDIKPMLDYAKMVNGEGIIIKELGAPYESKRSRKWLKLKLWKETTLRVTSYTPNNAGIRVEDAKGNACQVAGGQSKEVAQKLDEQGYATIMIQYLEKTKLNRYRFISYRGLAE